MVLKEKLGHKVAKRQYGKYRCQIGEIIMGKVLVGKIVSTHGIKGEVKILSSFNFKDKVFKTHGLDPDQTEAAIQATIKMLNLIETM